MVTEGNKHDVTVSRTLDLPRGNIVAIEKGYNDYVWHNHLTEKGIFFVTCLDSNSRYSIACHRPVLKDKELMEQQIFGGCSLSGRTNPITIT